MKLKHSFSGQLLPILKQNKTPDLRRIKDENNEQKYFAFALLLLWLLIYLITPAKAHAQAQGGLKVGDQMPNVSFGQIVNNRAGIKQLSDLKGKLVILDFWNTYCGSCLAAMHWMDSIQAKFGNRIHMLEVTDQGLPAIKSFFKLRTDSRGKKYVFNTVVGDKTLTKLFPHYGVPHIVWIGPDRKIIAITDLESVTEDNINRVLNHQSTNFGLKSTVDETKPLYYSGNITLDSTSSYSLFLKGHNPSLSSGTKLRWHNDVVYGKAFTNLYLLDIYEAIAYPLFTEKHDVFSQNRLMVEVGDSSRIIPKTRLNGFLEIEQEFTFELDLPVKDTDSLNTYLLSDLNRNTDFYCRVEKRNVKCLLLVRTDSVDRLKSAGGVPINTLFNFNPRFVNCPLRLMVNALNEEKSMKLPVVDATGYAGNVDLQLSKATDLQTISAEFNRYGLKLVPAFRELNMLVISDKKNSAIR